MTLLLLSPRDARGGVVGSRRQSHMLSTVAEVAGIGVRGSRRGR